MHNLKGMALAIELAERQQKEASNRFAQSQRDYGYSKRQLRELEDYLGDSEKRWIKTSQQALGVERLQGQYGFVDRLHQAIGLQEGVLYQLQEKCEQAKKKSQTAEFRLAILQRMMEKKQGLQVRALTRQEQKQTDEFASQQFARANARQQEGWA